MFLIAPELNVPVFVLYLSYCNEQNIARLRTAEDL